VKVLAIHPGPAFSVADVYVGWTEALRDVGCQVARYNLGDRLSFYGEALLPTGCTDEAGVAQFRRALTAEQVVELATAGVYQDLYCFQPDVLLVVSGFFLPVEVYEQARAHGTKVVLIHTESPYEDDRQLALAQYADVNLLNDPVNIEAYAALAPSYYLPHAYRPSLHHPGEPKPDLVCDLGFVGTGYPSRVEFFEAMGLDGLDVLLAGNWQSLTEDSPLRAYVGHEVAQCLDNTDAVDIYRSARVGINLYRREATDGGSSQGLAMGPREVEMAACGAFFLRDPRVEGDDVLSMLPTFTDPGDAGEQLRWWLARPDERVRLGQLARAAVADRTFDKHAAALVRLLTP
jgi:spore maturation protein CgeB